MLPGACTKVPQIPTIFRSKSGKFDKVMKELFMWIIDHSVAYFTEAVFF